MFYTVRQQLIVWDRITAAKFIVNGQQRPAALRLPGLRGGRS